MTEDSDFKHSIIDTVNATNQGEASYILIPHDVADKFDVDYYPVEFELEAGINEEGHLVLKYTRRNDKGNYDHLE